MLNDKNNMGNTTKSYSQCQEHKKEEKNKFVPVSQFEFLKVFEENTTNGLYLDGIYLPEEIIENILSYVPPKDLLRLSSVCKKWCNIIKSDNLWMSIYNRQYPNRPKRLPWYVFYCLLTTKNFDNLLKNGNGQEQFKHWKIIKNGGQAFIVENPPSGSYPLPSDVPDFNGFTGCFATSFYVCNKIQEIPLKNKRLLRYILNKFMPHIYVSEWVAGRFDCGCVYNLSIRGYGENYIENMDLDETIESLNNPSIVPLFHKAAPPYVVQQWEGNEWKKVEILIDEYPPNVATLIFEHEGKDTQFWAGHYGSKMAGGVVRVVFDSIQPLEDREI